MSQIEDPCREEELPSEGDPGGSTQQPVTPPTASYNEGGTPPEFPDLDLQTDFAEVEDLRYNVMVPRQYYYFPWILGSLLNLRNPAMAYMQNFLLNTDPEFRSISENLVDPLRFCLARVYHQLHLGSNNFMAHTQPGPDASNGLIFNTDVALNGEYMQVNSRLGFLSIEDAQNSNVPFSPADYHTLMQTYREDYLQITAQITENFPNVRYNLKQIDRLLPARAISHVAPEDQRDLVPPRDRILYDTTFRAPAAYYALEADDRLLPLPNQVSIKSYIPNQMTYEDEAPTWLGGEYDYEEDRYRSGREYAPELDKQSLYRRYSYEYGDDGAGVPFPCAQDDKVQKFAGNATKLIKTVNQYATDIRENRTFYNIARDVVQVHNRIKFSTSQMPTGPVTSLIKQHKLDNLLMAIIDIETPSNETVYAQILESKLSDTEYNLGDQSSTYYKPRAYESFLSLVNRYIHTQPDAEVEGGELDFTAVKRNEGLDQDDFPLGYQSDIYDDFWKNTGQSEDDLIHDRFIWRMNMYEEFAEFGDAARQTFLENQRNYKNILEGANSYSEVVGFRIEKTHAETQEVIQNFYLFNDPDVNEIDFIDSQVIYGQEYIYRIYTINFVQGTKYFYETEPEIPNDGRGGFPHHVRQFHPDPDNPRVGEYFLKMPVCMDSHHCIIEAPFFEQNVLVADLPPLAPDVRWGRDEYPDDPTRTNIIAFFREQFGHIRQRPTVIREEDNQIISKMKTIQQERSFLEYRSDSIPTHYQLFLSNEPPESYSDFADKIFVETSRAYPYYGMSLQKGTSVYACIRARDYAGISNPSVIYKITVDEVGHVSISEFEFEETSDELSFRSLLEIALAESQTNINLSTSADYQGLRDASELTETSRGTTGVTLGDLPSEESVWNKRFRFRMTSNSTGRSVEVESVFVQENARRRALSVDPIMGMNVSDIFSPQEQFMMSCTIKARERGFTEQQVKQLQEQLELIDMVLDSSTNTSLLASIITSDGFFMATDLDGDGEY